MSPPRLSVHQARKRFGGLEALRGVSFSVQPGQIHGLIGPNGAGKTSLFNLITGLIEADAGDFAINGQPYTPKAIDRVVGLGIARTFQNIRLFAQLTVLEHLLVGRLHLPTAWRPSLWPALARGAAYRAAQDEHLAKAEALLALVGLADHRDQAATSLSYGAQRRLEIARALATEPQLLALDEPAAGMNASEKQSLSRLLRQLRDQGQTILLIEHDVPMVLSLCDQITVLDQGQVIADGDPQTIRHQPAVVAAYLGSAA